ncbi:MAG TPA: hypothetical protein VL485_07845 [Ktedonobacteraceae bacterium]|nr:hypothetical protein [Ktedonobacteraceae bacterium]
MYQKLDNNSSNQERKFGRRKLLVGTSVVAGLAVAGAVGGGLALQHTNAAHASAATPVKLYRLNNGNDYLYLPETDTTELQSVQSSKYGYKIEGTAGYVYDQQVGNTSPIYRWNNGKEHFYTADPNERPTGYTKEGIPFYSYWQAQSLVGADIPSGYLPTAFYRATNGTIHFYTGSTVELISAQKQYKYTVEGAAWFVLVHP